MNLGISSYTYNWAIGGVPGFSQPARPMDEQALLAKVRQLGRAPNVILELWPSPEATIEASTAKEDAWTRESIRYLPPLVGPPMNTP